MSNLPGIPVPFSDLSTPAPSGVGQNPNLPPPAGSWLSILLQIAATVQLPTTAWQPGGPERTILSLMAVGFAQEDVNISIMAQGGFLDYAATGSVTTTALNGQTVIQYVTPDPTIPSQWPMAWGGVWQPGWLDALANSVYNVQRIAAQSASNFLAIVNTTNSSIGPYTAGTYHVANTSTGASYSNAASLTVPASLVAGAGGTITGVSGSGPVTFTTSAAHGLSVGQTVYVITPGFTLSQQIAIVSAVPVATQFQLNVTSSGSLTSNGTLYLATVAAFTADQMGPSGSSAPYTITTTVTQNNGVACANVLTFTGAAYETNVALAARCRLKLGALSPGGPSQAYAYFALTAATILGLQTPAVTLRGGPIVRVLVQTNPQTGVVTTTIANANPASTTLGANTVEGASNLLVTGAVGSGGLVKLTVGSTSGLTTGDWATVSGVQDNNGGNCGSTGTWQITVNDGTHLTLQGSTFVNTYVSGGVIEAGDLGQVDLVIQQNAVADNTTAITQSATAMPYSVAATIVVPANQVQAYTAAVTPALIAYNATIPLGGTLTTATAAPPGVLDYSAIEGVLFDAGIVQGQPSYVRAVTSLVITFNSTPYTTDVPFPAVTSQAVLTSFTPTVAGV